MKLRTIFLLIFILVAIVVGLFYYYQDTIFSTQFLKLSVSAQATANTGDEVTYAVNYKNDSKFSLKDPKIIFELPDNSLTEDNKIRFTQNLKDVAPGEEGVLNFSGILLGKEGDVKTARVWFSYMPENLSARYESNATADTKILATPINLTFDAPDTLASGKEANLTIGYASDINYPLENMSIKLQSPEGFRAISSTPNSLDGGEWKLPVLQKGKNGTIKIRGLIAGDSPAVGQFSLKLGMWQSGSFVVVKELDQEVKVSPAPVSINQVINNDAGYVATAGELLNYQVTVKNNSQSAMSNISVSMVLSGRALDLNTLTSSMAQINGNLLTFDSQKNPTLSSVSPGQEINVTFSVKIKDGFVSTENEAIKSKIIVGDITQEFVNKVGVK